MLNYIYWNVDPEIFRIGNFAVRWYGLLFAAAFYVGYMILEKVFQREKVSVELLDKMTIYTIVGTVIGARLGHCLFYDFDYYSSNPMEILKIWRGGLASHGAAIGILTSLYIFSRKYTVKSYFWFIDRIVIVVALGGAFIRLGNLMNSEIVGNPTTLPWGFVFERLGEDFARHPAQIYESLAYFATFFVLFSIYKKEGAKVAERRLLGLFLVMVFGARFILEFVKDVQVAFEEGMTLNMGQWLSIPLVLAGFFLIYLSGKSPQSKAHQ